MSITSSSPEIAASSPKSSRLRGVVSPRTVLILLLAAGVASIGYWWVSRHGIESTDDAYVRADAVAIAPKVSGYVLQVLVVPNQVVKKGQILAHLDARNYELELERAMSTVQARQADLQRSETEAEVAHTQVEQARNQLQLAELGLRHAREELDRYTPLTKTGAATGERLAELKLAVQQNETKQASALIDLTTSNKRQAASQAAIAQARAQHAAALAAQKQQQQQRDDTTLTSPLDGRVGDATTQVGQLVQPGTRLMTVVPTQTLYVVANFKETQIANLRVGQTVALHVDAFPASHVEGSVESFAPGTGSQFALLPADNATGNFIKVVQRVPVRIRLNVPDELRNRLLPGLSVTADVNTRDAAATHE